MARSMLVELARLRNRLSVVEATPGGTVTSQAIETALGFEPCPNPHSHGAISEVTGLQTALDGKQAAGSYSLTSHNHSGAYQPLGDYAAASHGHVIADVTGLQTALDGKQASGSYALTSHNHSGVYAPVSHSHVIADVTGLQAALDGKQPAGSYSLTSHNHSGVYEPTIAAGTTAQYWRGDKSWQTLPSGGADPWAYLKVSGADFSTTLATFTTITGLTFTPPANSTIEIEAVLLISTATATVGPRPGLNWAAGNVAGAVTVDTPTSATARALVNGVIGTIAGNAQAPVGGLPVVNVPYYASIEAVIKSGASPTPINVQLASETAGTAVKAQLGSFLKWRVI